MITKTANISADNLYRYRLSRTWDIRLPILYGTGNNPSKADAEIDDLTVTKFMGFASRWGYGGVVICNVYGYRATDPADLFAAEDPVGPGNWNALLEVTPGAMLCFWGDLAEYQGQGKKVEAFLRHHGATLYCLGLTKKGNPKHLSRLGYDTPMQLWTPARQD